MISRQRMLILSSLLSSSVACATDHAWVNPGGMWMPEQIKQQADLLQQLGVEDPAFFSDPQRMSSIVSLGFCSASFVSKQGLVITNHHCAAGAASRMTKEAQSRGDTTADYFKKGFYAPELKDEGPAGSGYHVYVTQSEEDVTSIVNKDLDKIQDPTERGIAEENRCKELVQIAEAADSTIKAEVKSYFRGEKFILIKKLNIKDVRVVYIPEQRIGNFGGDTDNWHWPRQVADFSFLRAYVGPDGKPRDYHPDNVPYQPKSFLHVEAKGIKDGDLALVAGYPGRTVRLQPAGEIAWKVEENIPFIQEKYGSLRVLLGKLSEEKLEWRKKLDDRIKSLDNSLKYYNESSAAVKRISYVANKKTHQDEVAAWALDSITHAGAIESMEKVTAALRVDWKKDDIFNNFSVNFISDLIHVFASATHIARMAEERGKPDAERHPDFQERKWEENIQEEKESQLGYDSELSRQILEWVLLRAVQSPAEQHPDFLRDVLDVEKAKKDPSYIRTRIDELYAATTLEKLETRIQLLNEATPESLRASKDPILQIGLKLAEMKNVQDNKDRHDAGALYQVVPRYMATLRAYAAEQKKLLAPDANSTLRITFGHVGGYFSAPRNEWQVPFTDLDSLVKKHKEGDPEFDLPEKIRTLVHKRGFEDVPVNFLAALDTTGGNSGSAAMNAKGSLVGLLFDGNSDALYSDYEFNATEVRSILVDIRYVLWIMKHIDETYRLLGEMGITGIQ